MPKPDAGNARARMNRAQRRKAPKILADKVGGKKKLAAMLEEAKARARAADAEKERAGHGVEITIAPPTKTKPPQDGVDLFGAGTVVGEGLRGVPVAMVAESDFDAEGGA